MTNPGFLLIILVKPMLSSKEIRGKYLEFFSKKNHKIIASSSLIPEGDSTLLFTNSGMFPLVPYLLGESHPEGRRLVDSQKCFRSGDIEEVGDHRHNTFFEMLGNWSLGDYFKQEQLRWWFEFLFEELKLDPKKIYQSVYVGDDEKGIPKDSESIEILKDIFKQYGIDAEVGPDTTGKGDFGPGVPVDFASVRIMAYRDKNWWDRGSDKVGEPGGPDSETFYDTGRPHDPKFGEHCHLNCDCGRFLEIGNSVFMQYVKTENGWKEMENKNVDFGGGLERIILAANGYENIFESDLFSSLTQRIEGLSGKKYNDFSKEFEIISDHIKAATFIMGDDKGVTPGNTGQNYFVRRLIRRAARYGRNLGIKDIWLNSLAEKVIEIYGEVYNELVRNKDFILSELQKEEERFAISLEKGLQKFEEFVSSGKLSGVDAFNLYQSYGFPIEITEELIAEKGISFIRSEFDEEYKKHQELSRSLSAGMFKSGLGDVSVQTTRLHTATHLLLAALRLVLGDQVIQKGSNITSERARLDFNHPEKLTPEQIRQAEDFVNSWIKDSLPVSYEEMTVPEAKDKGAMGVFESRYGEKVKVYKMGEGDRIVSYEICSGPHVSNTSELGIFKIAKEEASSAGIRRIKATLE